MAKSKSKIDKKEKEEKADTPELSPVDSESDQDEASESEDSVFDSADEYEENPNGDGEDGEEDSDEDEFEDQGSSDEDEDIKERQREPDEDSDNEFDLEENMEAAYERIPRQFTSNKKTADGKLKERSYKSSESDENAAAWMHTDNLSSDEEDEEGKGNRIGRVPLHWYDEYDHIGYDAHGSKVVKSASIQNGDRLDQAIAQSDQMEEGKLVVHDALNDRNVPLTARQLELIRRVQAGAFAHPEFDGTPDYIDYYSGIPEISGLNSDRYESKARFQPSEWEKLQVDRLLEKLKKGDINMDYLTGKVRDMNDVRKKKDGESDKPYLLWKGDEEDLLAMRKGPQHIAPPKVPPPGHAESYRPPDEYLPTEEDLKEWEDMEVKDRPHGRLVPKKFPNLRAVGAYEHSVTETFERCLDLYLCPRVMKRKLNIDPESLVPKLPKANDLRPFPTAKCIEYKVDFEGEEAPLVRCLSPSPDGQYLASGGTDGVVRLWEVQTGRQLRSWNLNKLMRDGGFVGDLEDEEETTKPIACLQWNPNRNHHCLVAAVGVCVVIIATGTAGEVDSEITTALLAAAAKGGNVTNEKAAKAVQWKAVNASDEKERTISAFDELIGPVATLKTTRDVASLRWHSKGDYFVSVSPKAGAASVLIHQLSKGNSQQPFSKTKGEPQLACFHPNKPFLFVSTQHHIRIYHLVKQAMVKRKYRHCSLRQSFHQNAKLTLGLFFFLLGLVSGCRWISSIDVHPTGDHLIVGSLDRRLMWFDLDLSSSPFKTLKYHERGLRSVQYHSKYPLMASSSDDGTIHVFHSMVYSDLMKNPLIVPVKILRGHEVTKKLGVLTVAFHPTQPWLFSGGADGRIFLYQDI